MKQNGYLKVCKGFMHRSARCVEGCCSTTPEDIRALVQSLVSNTATARPGRTFLFSSESVNEGHPDKLYDQVSDAILDTCLTEDPKTKVACETCTRDNIVMVAGKITTQAKIDYEKVLHGVVQKIGFDSYVDDLSSIDCKGLSYKTCEVLVRINKQRPDFAGGVHVGKEEMDYARATRVSCVATPATTTMPCL